MDLRTYIRSSDFNSYTDLVLAAIMTTMHLMHVFVFIQVALSFFCHTYVPDIIKARAIYAK